MYNNFIVLRYFQSKLNFLYVYVCVVFVFFFLLVCFVSSFESFVASGIIYSPHKCTVKVNKMPLSFSIFIGAVSVCVCLIFIVILLRFYPSIWISPWLNKTVDKEVKQSERKEDFKLQWRSHFAIFILFFKQSVTKFQRRPKARWYEDIVQPQLAFRPPSEHLAAMKLTRN